MDKIAETRFGDATTAAEVLRGQDLAGRLAVVTGAAAGIGKETARALADAGADVVLAGRNRELLEAVSAELATSARGRLIPERVDLLSLSNCADFADRVAGLGRPIDMLILNAGVMATPFEQVANGVELQMATNFLGHALIATRLAPALLRSAEPTLVSVSSVAHHASRVVFEDIHFDRRPYEAWDAYAQSKTAAILLAVRAADVLGAQGLAAFSLHPGGVFTGLLKHMSPDIGVALAERLQADFSDVRVKTTQEGAATTVLAATDPGLRGRGMLYLEDCHVAEVIDTPNHKWGVMSYALDSDNAERLFDVMAKKAGVELSFA